MSKTLLEADKQSNQEYFCIVFVRKELEDRPLPMFVGSADLEDSIQVKHGCTFTLISVPSPALVPLTFYDI